MKWIKSRKFILPAILLLFAVGGVLLYLKIQTNRSAGLKQENKAPDRIFKVKRGNMVIGIMLKGSVNAKTKHKLALEAPFSTKLIKVVDENAKVKAGDVVAEFETSDLLIKIDDFKLTIEQTKKDLAISKEERDVLISTNKEDLRTARDKVTECEDAYSRYVRLEGPRDRDTQELAVSDAEKELSESSDTLSTARDNYNNKVFSDTTEEKTAKQAIETAEKKGTVGTDKTQLGPSGEKTLPPLYLSEQASGPPEPSRPGKTWIREDARPHTVPADAERQSDLPT